MTGRIGTIGVFFIVFNIIIGCSHHPPMEQSVLPGPVFKTRLKPASHTRLPLLRPGQSPTTSIVAVGDIMVGSHVTQYLDKYGVGYPFDSTRHILKSGDVTFGNLEAPFSKTGTPFDKKFTFKIDPKYARGLPAAGFDVVTLANNHSMDFGEEALINTMLTLDTLGIAHCGASASYPDACKPAIVKRDGITIAFLGYTMTFPEEFWARDDTAGTCYPYETDMIATIQKCENIADYTVVTFHWGRELHTLPTDYQIVFAHTAIDAGADLILGHHPHILQGLEVYKNRLIIYSLGNFAFGSYSNKAKESIILKTWMTDAGLLYAKVFPISVHNAEVNFQPKRVNAERAAAVIDHLNDISTGLNKNASIINDDGIIWGEWKMPDSSLVTIQE
ncbi:CapA family protein [candidate division KSB1 bacterium]|nr:CapA family protein [candidate division KSB1 bacterium]